MSSRHLGALVGLACGDAVGTTVEFKPRDSFSAVTDMTGGGPFQLKPGQWTDDTSMALCLAESLVQCRGFDPNDQMRRYLLWYRKGHLSSTGRFFDIGGATERALQRYERRLRENRAPSEDLPYCGSTDPSSAGNGSLMRLAPIPLYFANDPERAIEYAALSSRTTHAAPEAVDACRYFAALMVGAVRGASKEELLASRFTPVPGFWDRHPLTVSIDAIARGSFKSKSRAEIRGSGYVVHSLEAALWSFHTTPDFRSGVLAAANLGEDADTTAAIYGQLAGAFYGVKGIPPEWREKLAHRDTIERLALALIP